MELPALSREESLELLEQLTAPADRAAAADLVAQVGGVPAHVLELGRAISVTQDDTFSGSLASLLQARVDLLSRRPGACWLTPRSWRVTGRPPTRARRPHRG